MKVTSEIRDCNLVRADSPGMESECVRVRARYELGFQVDDVLYGYQNYLLQ